MTFENSVCSQLAPPAWLRATSRLPRVFSRALVGLLLELTFNEAQFMGGGRTVMGILGGDSDVGPFLLELIDHHLAGRFPYERMVENFPFERINEAIEAGECGRVVKPVLVMSTG